MEMHRVFPSFSSSILLALKVLDSDDEVVAPSTPPRGMAQSSLSFFEQK